MTLVTVLMLMAPNSYLIPALTADGMALPRYLKCFLNCPKLNSMFQLPVSPVTNKTETRCSFGGSIPDLLLTRHIQSILPCKYLINTSFSIPTVTVISCQSYLQYILPGLANVVFLESGLCRLSVTHCLNIFTPYPEVVKLQG